MDTLTRLRHTEKRILRLQRRIWLAEAVLWPALAVVALSVAAGLVWWLRRRRSHRLPAPETGGAIADPRSNGAGAGARRSASASG